MQTNNPTNSLLMIPVGAGEVLDRLTILKLKEAAARTAEQRSTIRLEQELLTTEWRRCLGNAPETSPEWGELLETNASLWQLEDKVREVEREGNFGPDFISAARSIYLTNDRRARIKRAVNTRVGSSICDFKFHDAEAGVNP